MTQHNSSALDVYEEWRPILWAEGYEVSSFGRVSSWRPLRNMAKPPTERRLLRLTKDKDGYNTTTVYVGGLPIKRRVCRLVAETWHGVGQDGCVVRHLDGSRNNDVPSNLAWGSVQDNSDDMLLHGTRIVGNRVNTSRLNEADVVNVLASPKGHSALAREYGVTPGAIWHIRVGRTWKHVGRI